MRHGAHATRDVRKPRGPGAGGKASRLGPLGGARGGGGVRAKAWGRRGRRAACSAEVVTLAAAGEDDDVFVGDLLPFSALSRGDVLAVFFSS